MNTVITYASKTIDFKEDLDAFFCIKANSDYLDQTFNILVDMQPDQWTPLNTADPNYLLFVKSLVFIVEYRYDQMAGFCMEFNHEGRPFARMKKVCYTEQENAQFKEKRLQKVVQMYNKRTFVPLYNAQDDSMATKKTDTPAPQILLPETVNNSFLAARKEVDERIAEARAVIEIKTPEEAKAAAAIVKSFKPILTKIEATRKALKAPYKNAADLIDGTAKLLVDEAEPQLKRVSALVLAWDKQVADAKKAADDLAAANRLAEEQKANAAQQELTNYKNWLIQFEQDCAKSIINENSQDNLVNFWEAALKPFDPQQAPESLRPDAEAMKNRLIALGTSRDALLVVREMGERAPAQQLADAEAAWNTEQGKYSHLVTVAVQAIDTKVTEAAGEIALGAEIAKSQITATQLGNIPEKNLNTRKTWKYRVIDIAIVPAAFTMTVINDAAVKDVMQQYKANIEAGEQGIPGVEFYCEEIPSGR